MSVVRLLRGTLLSLESLLSRGSLLSLGSLLSGGSVLWVWVIAHRAKLH